MPRPAKGSFRRRGKSVQFRIGKHSWTVDGAANWSDTRIESELEKEVWRYKLDPESYLPPVLRPTTLPSSGGRSVAKACEDYRKLVEDKGAGKPRLKEKSVAEVIRRLEHIVGYEPLAREPALAVSRATLESYQSHKVKEREHLAELRGRRALGERLSDDELKLIVKPQHTGLSNAGINKTIAELARVIDRELELRPAGSLQVVNPARSRSLAMEPEETPRVNLTVGQVMSLLKGAAAIDAEGSGEVPRELILRLLICCAPRVSEAMDIRRQNVLPEAGLIQIPRGKTAAAQREFQAPRSLLNALVDHMAASPFKQPTDYVLPTRNGTARDPARVRDRVLLQSLERAREIAAAEGADPLPARMAPHDLRRTACGLFYQAGRNPGWVMDTMGHTSAALALEVYRTASKRPLSKSEQAQLKSLLDWDDYW